MPGLSSCHTSPLYLVEEKKREKEKREEENSTYRRRYKGEMRHEEAEALE